MTATNKLIKNCLQMIEFFEKNNYKCKIKKLLILISNKSLFI